MTGVSSPATATLAQRMLRDYEAVAARLPATVVPPARRIASLQRIAELGLPHLRDDHWRYANLRPIEKARFAPAQPWSGTYSAAALGLPEALPGIGRQVFVNGRHVASLSTPVTGSALSFGAPTLAAEPSTQDTAATPSVNERFAWLNEAFVEDGASIRARAGSQGAIEVLFVSTANDRGAASYPRLEIWLDAGAKLTVLERHLGTAGDGALVIGAAQVNLAPDAQLTHYRVQNCAPDMTYIDSLLAEVGPNADYCLTALALGAKSARSSMRVALTGRNAGVRLRGMALADDARVLDLAVLIDHAAPDTRSTQVFRAVANQRARIACNSHVRVGTTAPGADSRQSLKGLVGAAAEINLRPQLEIFTNEVSASHGATTGALDENTLFYLLSRGIEPETARVLLEWAFLEDVLAQIELPALRKQLERISISLLGNAPALQELL